MNDLTLFGLEDVMRVLPHRTPFLFVDRVMQLEPHKSIMAERLLRAEEPQFAGHFPGRPIMPGVLVAEALAQASGLLLGLSDRAAGGPPMGGAKMYFLAATNLKFTHPAGPGDCLRLRSASDKSFGGLFRFSVEAVVGEKVIASGSLMLARVEGDVGGAG